jgi:hypothetical protein
VTKGLAVSEQLTMLFAVISIAITFALECSSTVFLKQIANSCLDNKAQAITTTLGTAVADAISVSGAAAARKMLINAVGSDPDLIYALIVTPSGAVLAATDPEMGKRGQAANDFERDALKVKDYKVRKGMNAGTLETIIPVKNSAGRAGMGVLRIGFSSKRTDGIVMNAVIMGTLIGIVALLLGGAVFKSVGNQIENTR